MGSSYSHETYHSRNRDRDGSTYKATFETQPFSQGVFRYAFKGVLEGYGPRTGDACVTKVFKKRFAKNFDQWVPDLAASEKSLEFAEKFNLNCIPILNESKNKTYRKIDFLIPLIAKVYDVSHFKLFGLIPIKRDESFVELKEYVAIEPFLEGNYKKFNSNYGYENPVHELMSTFSHWTWIASKCRFMVCDLQGVDTYKKYILTDPAVHSLDQIYGITDLGAAGMQKILAHHKCNSLCRILQLENPLEGQGVGIVEKKSSTYSFQVPKEKQIRALKRHNRYMMSTIFE